MRATLYVEIDRFEADRHARGNSAPRHDPIASSLTALEAARFTKRMKELVREGVEADIAVTNSRAAALRIVRATKKTSVVLLYAGKVQRNSAVAVVGLFPGRVTALAVEPKPDGKSDMVKFLLNLASDKAKES